jgi:hypothetical protein
MSCATRVYRAQWVFVGKSSFTFSPSQSSIFIYSTANKKRAGYLEENTRVTTDVCSDWLQQQLETLTDCTG